MIIYLVEFAILHILFYLIYKALLAKETQLGFLRLFILGSSAIALTLPLMKIPTKTNFPTIDTEAILLPVFDTSEQVTTVTPWYLYVLAVVSVLLFLKLALNLTQIYGWYRQSEPALHQNITIRKVSGLQNSFTFLKWIFIDPKNFENPVDIIRHEAGHARKLHTVDLLFFNLLSICFWWEPTIWLMLKELKNIHEFEADAYALRIDNKTYTKTLVHCTLKAHGMDLASSFDDAPIFNRLNFMKKMKKKISVWKVASIAMLVAVSGVMFACEEEIEAELTEIIEESNLQTEYSADVQAALDQLRKENPNEKYAVVETLIDNEESVKKLNSYDPDQIQRLFVETNDGKKSVVMIVNQASKLFEKSIEIQEQAPNEAFTIVDETASFVGGIEAFGQYLGSNLKYPKQAEREGVEGRVYVQFVVMEDGSIADATIVKGIGAGCDAEALRVIQESPNWVPGKVNGKTVKQKMIQNIVFKLPT